MFNSDALVRAGRIPVLLLVLVAAILSGCESRQEKALDQAKAQAAKTGAAAAGGFSRQEWDHDDDSGTAAGGGADERSDHDDADSSRCRGARSSSFGTDGFRGAATGQRDHPGGHHADDPDRSAHQRKNQPRG